jgi:TPR repeat protein
LWLKGAERGDARAQRVVGDFYLRGVGVERSPGEAQRWLAAAADQGNAAAMVLLGGLILQDQDSAERFTEAVDLFRRAAAQGNTDGEYNLGVCFRRGLGVNLDEKAAEQCYRSAAQRNHTSAQIALADLIAWDTSDENSWREATHWYRLAADTGNAVAKARLTLLIERRRDRV